MNCCQPFILPFYNTPISYFGYSQDMRNTYGNVPRVEVLYYDDTNNEYYLSTNQSAVRLTGNPTTNISVDHGGPASGIIRIV